MPRYSYRAVTPAGDVSSGELEAANEAEIVDRLRDQGLMPMQIGEAARTAGGTRAAKPARAGWFTPKRVTRDNVLGITRELGPVLAGLMVAGRVGASIAAELGTMRVTEQIDALTTLATDPFKYLVAPRLIAGTLTLPVLVLVADIIGVMGGWIVGVAKLDFNSAAYLRNTWDFLQFEDVFSGLVKAAAFGFIISLMGCYNGYRSKGGAQGVGQATTNAVVSASILILTFNYLITEMFFAR